MVEEIKSYKIKDLVLKVNPSYNPLLLNINAWNYFLDTLCGERFYQKQAIRNAILYFGSGNYNCLEDLIKENWTTNSGSELKKRYKDIDEYLSNVQIQQKLWANIDLATGTGKSFVIYGIAQVMLGLGLVDKVLVLCPSLTIEKELKLKFYSLSTNIKLKNALPEGTKYNNPSIISGNDTIRDGCICIENIHAVYENNSSSIRESLRDKGNRTLVLNDEAHHIFNTIDTSDKSIKKWKEFLIENEFGFMYMLGFTGTAYINNEYFNDVIYRYSLREAIDDKVIKMINYVSKDDSSSDSERFQKILDNHNENKRIYSNVKPLTILITKDISSAKRLAEEIQCFLLEKGEIVEEQKEKKIIVVTSDKKHINNVAKLSNVDNKDEPTEWIVSVSMLTEGWDVKNVFQIVPWQDKAFNSKLLIAQVLGRGLRIPMEYTNPQPKVKVFNHSSFSKNIEELVNEVLEIETKLVSSKVDANIRGEYGFELYNIEYEKKLEEKEPKVDTKVFDYTKGYMKLIAQVETTNKETEYETIKKEYSKKTTTIHYHTYLVDEIVERMHLELQTREWEGKVLKLPQGEYSKDNLPTKEEIKNIIRNSMNKVGIRGDSLVEENKQKILTMFSTLLRKKGKIAHSVRKVTTPIKVDVNMIGKESLSIGNLRRGYSVFYTDNYRKEVSEDVKNLLESVVEDQSYPKSAERMVNRYLFKTNVDIVFTKGEPERRFVEMLCKVESAGIISAWIKSRNQGFYSIEYSITSLGGKHSTQAMFNPDFFILIKKDDREYILVIEIKEDEDNCDINKAKFKYANEHFNNLNAELSELGIKQEYIFHFVSPCSYNVFFEYLRNGNVLKRTFRSSLEDLIEDNE